MHVAYVVGNQAMVLGFGPPPSGVRFVICFSQEQVFGTIAENGEEFSGEERAAIEQSFLQSEQLCTETSDQDRIVIDTAAAGTFIDQWNRYNRVCVPGGASNWHEHVQDGTFMFNTPRNTMPPGVVPDGMVGSRGKDGMFRIHVAYSRAQFRQLALQLAAGRQELESNMMHASEASLPEETDREMIVIGEGETQPIARFLSQCYLEGKWLS